MNLLNKKAFEMVSKGELKDRSKLGNKSCLRNEKLDN